MADSPQTASAGATQPPYLKHVHLRNVPPLRDVSADFKPGLNVIIGKNGSGKTQFLKLVGRLIPLFKEHYSGQECELVLGGKDDITLKFEEQSIYPESIKENFPNQLLNQQLPLLITATNRSLIKKATTVLGATSGLLSVDDYYSVINIGHGLPSVRLPIIDESTELILSNYGRILLDSAQVEKRKSAGRLVQALYNTVETLVYRGPVAGQSIESIGLDIIRKLVVDAFKIHLNSLNGYLATYSPLQEVRLNEHFQVYQTATREAVLVNGLVIEFKIEEEWLPFNALSDGTKRVFYLLSELVSAETVLWGKGSKKMTRVKFNEIILLEEPELGIHPDQLHLLLQLIREVSREHQVIMTTHSPQTLDMLTKDELDRITICEYLPGKGTKMRKLSAAKKKKAKYYLRDNGFLSEFWRFSNLEDPD